MIDFGVSKCEVLRILCDNFGVENIRVEVEVLLIRK